MRAFPYLVAAQPRYGQWPSSYAADMMDDLTESTFVPGSLHFGRTTCASDAAHEVLCKPL